MTTFCVSTCSLRVGEVTNFGAVPILDTWPSLVIPFVLERQFALDSDIPQFSGCDLADHRK